MAEWNDNGGNNAAGIGPRLVGYQLSSNNYAYMMRLIELGIFEGKIGEMKLNESAQKVIDALHEVVAGGEVEIKVVHKGHPDLVNELRRRQADGLAEANVINGKAGYYVTAAT